MNLFEHESGQRKSVLSNLKSMIMGNEQDIQVRLQDCEADVFCEVTKRQNMAADVNL